jgi:ATP-dependent Lhr-like helicase
MRWTIHEQPLSFALCRARRDVLLGADPTVTLTKRAVTALGDARAVAARSVRPDRTVIDHDCNWWTYAGARANATLAAALSDVVSDDVDVDNDRIQLRTDLAHDALAKSIARVDLASAALPAVDDDALRGLKFAESLPPDLAVRTLSERLLDRDSARAVLSETRRRVKP